MAVVHARRVTESMITAAADAIAELTDATSLGAALLPPITDLRMISTAVAITVARTADEQGLAQQPFVQTRWSRFAGRCGAPSIQPSCRSKARSTKVMQQRAARQSGRSASQLVPSLLDHEQGRSQIA